MRFMMVMIPRVYQPDTPPGEKAGDGFAPAAEAVAKMMKFNEELAKAGALIALDGLHPSSKGARVSFAGGKPQVTDGPFTQAKEVIGGYWMIEAKSKEEAVGWAKRCPAADGDAIEVRQVFEVSDFPQDVRNAADNPTVRVHLESGKPRDATRKDEIMKYVCLGYSDENKWETMSENEQKALIDQCFAYDDVLRKNGNFAGGEALQSARTAATLRWVNGKVSVTDGPFTETKEQLGGILVLEARDLNHAIELMSKHPGVKAGPFEIRPAADLSAMVAESERRRSRERKAS